MKATCFSVSEPLHGPESLCLELALHLQSEAHFHGDALLLLGGRLGLCGSGRRVALRLQLHRVRRAERGRLEARGHAPRWGDVRLADHQHVARHHGVLHLAHSSG